MYRQDKKLKDAFALLQQENESLRRANEQLMQRSNGGMGGGSGASMQMPQTVFNTGGLGVSEAQGPCLHVRFDRDVLFATAWEVICSQLCCSGSRLEL